MSFFRIFLGASAIFLLFSAFAPALQAAGHKGTGLPLPRFVSLRAGEVNLRTGPGVQHPVDWVYHRQNLPLEIIAEYGTWRKMFTEAETKIKKQKKILQNKINAQ